MARDHIEELLEKELEEKALGPQGKEIGRVVSVGDGIVQIEGLPSVVFSEMVEISRWPGTLEEKPVPALILNLEEYTAGAVVLGEGSTIKEGDVVQRTGSVLSVPVG